MSGVAREAMEDVAPAAPGVGEFGVASCGVLLASVVGVIFGPTGLVISSFSLFIEPIAADLDWDRGQSALPVTLLGPPIHRCGAITGVVLVLHDMTRGHQNRATPSLQAAPDA
ncbi:hypothetical protein ACLI37_30475, partial [Pseudomonas aeruginosa]